MPDDTRSRTMSDSVEHWGPDEAKWLNPQDELDELEFGWRTSWFFFTAECASRYTPPVFDLSVFTPWGAKHDPEKLVFS